jgi:Dockerin type I domain/CARDB
LRPLTLPMALLMLLCLLCQAVTDQRQVTENHGKASIDRVLAERYALDSVSDVETASNQSSSSDLTDHKLKERSAEIDCAEKLPAKMELQFHGAPVLGAITRLSLVVVSGVDAPNTEIRIVLPEGFSLSSGSLQWHGNLSRNITVQVDVFIRADLVGVWRIESVAISKPLSGYRQICSTQCYVQVAEKEAHVLGPVLEGSAEVGAAKLDSDEDPKQLITSLSNGTISVHGHWFYENEVGTSIPARYARVELWNDSASGDVLLQTTSVQSDGYYEFPAIESDNETLAVYVELFCQCHEYQIIRVYDSDYLVYWSQTSVRNATGEYLDMGSWLVQRNQSECWKIYDDIVDGYFWLLNKTGWSRSEVYVTITSSFGGSMCFGDDIFIYPGDGWIRGTVLHEYGHGINYATRGHSFPPSNFEGNEHYPDTEADLGWAISEGWAEFFPCAVDNNPLLLYGRHYGSLETTTYADGPFGNGDYGDWDGDHVEGAVAQVFWDIFDGESSLDYPAWDLEGYGDHIFNEFDKLWNIFLNYDPNSILEFWNWWNPKDVCIWDVFRHARILEPRDIVVTNVMPSQQNVVAGEMAQVNVTVKNQGQIVENLNVTVLASSLLIGSLENITLESHESETFTFNWNTTGVTRRAYTISARAVMFPEDLNTTDDVNAGSVVYVLFPGQAGPGDVNADGKVNILDMVRIAIKFGMTYPNVGWDPNADINSDGKINILDIVVVAIHYGEVG